MFQYTVNNGDTIESIANKFGISVESLKQNNKINRLIPNSVINIPNNKYYNYYIVRRGDNLGNIARTTGVDKSLLALINGLENYDYLYPGQILLIPKKGVKVYVTKSGDTIQSVLRSNRTSFDTLIKNNPNVYLYENQILFL